VLASGGNTIASLLLGYPSQVVRALNPFDPKYHTNEPSLYVQDDWRTTSWLTLNLGLRYDIFTPFTEEGNHLANFDPGDEEGARGGPERRVEDGRREDRLHGSRAACRVRRDRHARHGRCAAAMG
jgi:outer membrane receptor protein involved in Fe transport